MQTPVWVYEAARILASDYDGITKIYLACRNPEKAKEAKYQLQKETQKDVFHIMICDTSDTSSVLQAVDNLDQPVDAFLMNAGGFAGKNSGELNSDGVMNIMATNVLGHVVMLEALIKSNKLTKCALYSSSEAARGAPLFGFFQPKIKTGSVDEFKSILDGSYFGSPKARSDSSTTYSYSKLVATYYMTSIAQKYPQLRIISVSPGATAGTNILDHIFKFNNEGFFQDDDTRTEGHWRLSRHRDRLSTLHRCYAT